MSPSSSVDACGAHDLDELGGLLLVAGELVDLDEPPVQRAVLGGHRLVDGRRGDDLAVAGCGARLGAPAT